VLEVDDENNTRSMSTRGFQEKYDDFYAMMKARLEE
jgi:hypothetical protein